MKREKVYITRQIPQAGIDYLAADFDVEVNPEDRPLSASELLEKIRDVDGVLCLLTDRINPEVFDAAPQVRGYANYAVGYDNIDVSEATRRGIPVSNTPGVLTDATAEMAWALLFAAARRIVESDSCMRSGAWKGWGPMQFIGGDITGATLGILGAGRIGTAMALKSRGFGMKVIYQDAIQNKVLEEQLGAKKVDLDTILRESDYLSVHVPLLPETRGLINTDALKKMKKSAYLINTARGPIVDEAALVEALKNGEIAGAGLDVYEKEPIAAPGLSELSNVVMTPHTASATFSSRTNMALKAAKNLAAMVKGETAPDCVNPEIYRQK
jgi:glyoxylate reductase